MKKRLLSLLLILCLCAALLPAMVLAEDNVTIVTTEEKLKDAIKKGGSVQLGENITLNETLEINNNTVILDLNGKVLSRTELSSFGAIRVTGSNASLTLTDNSNEKNGKIFGFILDGVGGGVYVEGGSFIMNGGTIDSCAGMKGGGGVYLTNGASFTMNAGTIKRCTANERALGGGVYVDSDCTFIMEGGNLVELEVVKEAYARLSPRQIIAYAPIQGYKKFLESCIDQCFGESRPSGYINACATPGGTGALHHAIHNYSADGDEVLITDWHWGAYDSLIDYPNRKVASMWMLSGKKWKISCHARKILSSFLTVSPIIPPGTA